MSSSCKSILYSLAAALVVTLLVTTPALAGSGVGGVFNLGSLNTVDHTTRLKGDADGTPQLWVQSEGTAAGVRADAGPGIAVNGISVSGIGQLGKSTSSVGLVGWHGGSSGTAPGLKGQTNSADGPAILGQNFAGGPALSLLTNSVTTTFGGSGGLDVSVDGQRALRLEPNDNSPNLIGGFSGNAVQNGAYGATIAGGGESGEVNLVYDNFGTVGDGVGNTAGSADGDPTSAPYATVAGGLSNTASGYNSTVSGGYNNTASGSHSTVAGYGNTASGYGSSVSGGYYNTASGSGSIVSGGVENTASGAYSFAAGYRAQATQQGAYVWGDYNTNLDVTSPAANSFTVRASGGIWLGTTSFPSIPFGRFINTSTGAYLSSAGAWTNNSDQAKKHLFRGIDPGTVAKKVGRMPITSWSYKAEQPSVRHIGPTAQAFYQAFGLGLDKKHITTIDEGGVALAAIKGLYWQNQALRRQNQVLTARLGKLEQAVARLSR